ncbi:MAG: pyridoxal phosphate-dependent aminotransferase [Oligoflexus sp.]
MELPLSKRISALKPSPTVALNGKATEMARQGIKVFNFAVGEPDFPTPELITSVAIDSLQKGRTKYAPAGGSPALRQAIQKKLLRDNQLQYEADEIVVGIGAKEILFHIMLALLNEGDEVLVPAPYWVSYPEQIEAAGGKAVIIPMPDDHHAPRLSPEAIAAYATPRTRAIILNSPNNPAGYIIKNEELKAIGQYLSDQPWWIIGDEIYEYMSFAEKPISLAHLVPEIKDRYILVNGLSKGFAMTGWRVGYMAGPKPVAKLVKTLQSQSSTCLPPFIEDASIVALDHGRGVMADKFQVLQDRRDLAVKCLRDIPDVDMIPPEGAFYVFIDIRKNLQNSTHQVAKGGSFSFGEYLLEKYHVAMVPGEAFGVPGFLRLSYAVSEDDIRKGIEKLGQALASIR